MLKDKVKELPQKPGIYIFKDSKGAVIYVGKASKLRTRVSQYFSPTLRDTRYKIHLMMPEVAELSTIEAPSEIEALFLESELIKRYQPKFNSEWKDERNYLYVRINFLLDYPALEYVRRPQPDKATYLGPFIDSSSLKKSLRYLRKVFPYHTHMNLSGIKRACLDFHIGLCPGPEVKALTPKRYKDTLNMLISVLKGRGGKIVNELKREMNKAAIGKDFEAAAILRDRIRALENLKHRIVFGDLEKYGAMSDEGVVGLQNVLKLEGSIKRIEAYDISNFAGKEAVGSMVVFENGIPNRGEYKRFKIKYVRGIDDFAMMHEVLRRRFANKWNLPDLILIDGGKGQLSSALRAMSRYGFEIPMIGLAKREEEIVTIAQHELLKTKTFKIIKLSHTNPALKLLQRIRDEAHRFAVLYHTNLRAKKMTRSFLDDIDGIGSETKRKLLLHFGSAPGIKRASFEEISRVAGKSKAKLIKNHDQN